MTVWNNTIPECRCSAIPGSIIIWNYDGTDNGHVGIVVKVSGRIVETIEGNTGDQRRIIREGDGVYRRKRFLDHLGNKMKLIGYLNPWPSLNFKLVS